MTINILDIWLSKYEMMNQCWVNAGPTSQAADQHSSNIGSTFRVFPAWNGSEISS